MISSKSFNKQLFAVLVTILLNLTCVPAPVPRCSFFIIINKLAEYSNALSDSNPYFPVPPCEYGGPWQAIRAGDFESVFILARPEKIPRHNFYELIWFLRKGMARIQRIRAGKEPWIHDDNILREGYRHYTPYVRTRQIGTGELRRPEIIDNPKLYSKVISANIRELNANRERERQQQRHRPHSSGPFRPRPKRKIPQSEEVVHEYPEQNTLTQVSVSPAQSGGYRLPVELKNYEVSQHHQQQQPQQQQQYQQPPYQPPQQQQQQFQQQPYQPPQQQPQQFQQPPYQPPQQQQPYTNNVNNLRDFRNLQADSDRSLEGGFLPGFSPNPPTPTYEDESESLNIFNERSDIDSEAILTPEPSSAEFRPHQKVYRTKTLEPEPSNFGDRIRE